MEDCLTALRAHPAVASVNDDRHPEMPERSHLAVKLANGKANGVVFRDHRQAEAIGMLLEWIEANG